ncbi:hypothetical protein DSO57_1014299 [Entomophthora muscae]|uniref:Uncharacterized protein n=1 Tax=Entomophthora muscae TaxID=34485 RepID=A0ACC2RWU7_9FUNG|nr:hypothetical protein DSO57_1014299 [Entomophthora muscae]
MKFFYALLLSIVAVCFGHLSSSDRSGSLERRSQDSQDVNPQVPKPVIISAFASQEPATSDTEVIGSIQSEVPEGDDSQEADPIDRSLSWLWILLGIILGVAVLGGAVYCVTAK